jgi:sigma-54 specific flagellar transcriptional regulator A
MQGQHKTVLICEAREEIARRIASQVEFLGYRPQVAVDAAGFMAANEGSHCVGTVLVGSDPHFDRLANVLRTLSEKGSQAACYLLQDPASDEAVPAELTSRIRGVLSLDLDYQQLQDALDECAGDTSQPPGDEAVAQAYLRRQLVGGSDDMQSVHRLIMQVARTEASVLVTGESGTGKEVVARAVHSLSSRRDAPFVPVNCGAIPAELLESELFGHEKGAFTGAVSTRQGRFEIAQGGTLFLDEIGDMPLDMQVKLLRVLQERTFERVGSHKTRRCDVRIIAATHRNLEQLVAEGKFRMDLFYRLNVFPIEIMPLRKHPADIPALVACFARKLQREQGISLQLTDNAQACLGRYYWPGNVRELYNLLERMAILFPGQPVQWSDLPEKYRPNHELFTEQESVVCDSPVKDMTPGSIDTLANLPSDGIDLRPHLAGIERSLMTQALAQSEWVVARAAKLLNLQRTTLVEKMRKFEIQRPEELPEY